MLENIMALLAGLTGLGAFISAFVNVLKVFRVVKDGSAEKWLNGFNLVAFVAVTVVYFMNIQVNWLQIDGILILATTFLGLILQLFATQQTYQVTKDRIPLIGYSYSD